jgi:ArsR family transcriptional regulator, arsenate/arsenite/antimonite-responsive transcriptional repressor
MKTGHSVEKAQGTASAAALAAQIKVLADPTRLAILELCMSGQQCNCNLGERLGLPMNLISHHLKVLREAGLVTFSRDAHDGRWIHYVIDTAGIARLHGAVAGFLDPLRITNKPPACVPQAAKAGRKIAAEGGPGRLPAPDRQRQRRESPRDATS